MSYWNDLLRNDEGVIYHGERKTITKWLFDSLSKNRHRMTGLVRELLNPETNGSSEGFLVGVSWRGVVSASQSTADAGSAKRGAGLFGNQSEMRGMPR